MNLAFTSVSGLVTFLGKYSHTRAHKHTHNVVLPGGVVMHCHAEDWHWTGMERNFAWAEKQYSVSYSIRRYLYGPEITRKWLYIQTHTLFNQSYGKTSGALDLTACLCQEDGTSFCFYTPCSCVGCCGWRGCTSSGGRALPWKSLGCGC